MALFLTGKQGRLLRRNAALQRPFPIILSSSLVIFHMSGVSLHVRGSFNEEWLTSSHCIFFSFSFFLAPWLNYHIQAQTTTKRKKEKKKKTMGFYADVKKHEICGRALMESGVLWEIRMQLSQRSQRWVNEKNSNCCERAVAFNRKFI